MTEFEKVPAAHAAHGFVAVTDEPTGHGGPVVRAQLSESPAPSVT